jgi:hypothetical protein
LVACSAAGCSSRAAEESRRESGDSADELTTSALPRRDSERLLRRDREGTETPSADSESRSSTSKLSGSSSSKSNEAAGTDADTCPACEASGDASAGGMNGSPCADCAAPGARVVLAEVRPACSGPPKRGGASRGCAALCGSGAEDDGLERGANTLGWSTVEHLQSGVDVDFEGTAERRNGCWMHAHAPGGSGCASLLRVGAGMAAYLHCPPTVLVEEAATLGASRKVGTGRRHILGRRRIRGDVVRERCTP